MRKLFKLMGWGAVSLMAFAILTFGVSSHLTSKALATTFTPPESLLGEAVPDLEFGERIVRVRNGCVDCHGEDFGGKYVVDDPAMGQFYAPNLTPYGLQDWSDEEIAKAIRYGLDRTNKPLVFMPSMEYHPLSQADLASVVAYLRTLAPVERERKPKSIGPIAKLLYAMGKLPLLASSHTIDFNSPFNQKPDEAPTREFGEYLANTGCIGCHGPTFTGGPIPGGPPDWAPAASLRLGTNSAWTEEGFAQAMKEGTSFLTGQKLRAPMPIALTSQMNETELKALWLYFSSLK